MITMVSKELCHLNKNVCHLGALAEMTNAVVFLGKTASLFLVCMLFVDFGQLVQQEETRKGPDVQFPSPAALPGWIQMRSEYVAQGFPLCVVLGAPLYQLPETLRLVLMPSVTVTGLCFIVDKDPVRDLYNSVDAH